MEQASTDTLTVGGVQLPADPDSTETPRTPDYRFAVPFRTGTDGDGFLLDSVVAAAAVSSGAATPRVSVHVDGPDGPGRLHARLDAPSALTAELDVFTTADRPVLHPRTTYWVVFENTTAETTYSLAHTPGSDADTASGPGWSFAGSTLKHDGDLSDSDWEAITNTRSCPCASSPSATRRPRRPRH